MTHVSRRAAAPRSSVVSARVLAAAALLAAAGFPAACAGSPAGTQDGGGGSGTRPSRASGSGTPTIQTFPADTRAFMEAGLRQFSSGDARWSGTRAAWLAMGERESEFLVQTMWGALLKSQELNAPDLVERARHELALIGAPSVPLMAAVLEESELANPTDAEGRTVRVAMDDGLRREAAEILTIIGAPAVPAVLGALGRAESKGGRRFALRALGQMGTRGGPEASAALLEYARSDDDLLRIEAITGMRHHRDAATGAALVTALGDGERLVRENAAESLVVRGDRSVLGSIRAAADRARASGQIAEARRMDAFAVVLEKPRK